MMVIAWLNFAVLFFSTLLFLYFYVLSVSPAALEKVIGAEAYARCGRYRVIAIMFEVITVLNYILYKYYPIEIPLPDSFPWSWWISAVIALVIAVPTIVLMFIGLKHAGDEAIAPKKEHTMYGGIYEKIRHPQAAGEVFAWVWIGFLLHSFTLVVFSLVYFPIFLIMCWAEEHDLLIRFGEPYAEYMRNTGAFWPKRGR